MTVRLANEAPDFFCSLESRAQNELLLGSAPQADVWFMLEYPGKWGAKVFADSPLAESLGPLIEQINRVPNSRLMAIKKEGKIDGEIAFFAALSGREKPQLLQFTFKDYTDLLELDIAEIIESPERYQSHFREEAIFLICTNGLRDKCCARNGLPVYQQVKDMFGDQIWQSSHHGGHRHSANMLKMPQGLSFGQIDQGDAPALISSMNEGHIPLRHFRGRSSLDKVAQAAEALLLSEMEFSHEDALKFQAIEDLNGGEWRIMFSDRNGIENIEAIIEREESEQMMFASCIGEKQVPQVTYRLKSMKQDAN